MTNSYCYFFVVDICRRGRAEMGRTYVCRTRVYTFEASSVTQLPQALFLFSSSSSLYISFSSFSDSESFSFFLLHSTYRFHIMTLIGTSPITRNLDCLKLPNLGFKSSIRPPSRKHIGYLTTKTNSKLTCSFSSETASQLESRENGNIQDPAEEEFSHATKFPISDFDILDRVSIGLGGRVDEAVFEARVTNSHSPLYNTRVVLRQLTSVQAQRRGKRAIQVLKKLARRRLMYHSYSMKVYGYVCPSENNADGSFSLVHGYDGSFSLRHWLQQSDWFPTLEATLALDEESVRKVGDDTVGGPAASRQLRLTRILMRDLLIGVNYLHSHGLAHTELRLENLHISPIDRHIKVGILGNAADFCESSPNNNTQDENTNRRQMMIAFDIRCVGFIVAKMVLQELMDPIIFAKFKAFLTEGNDSSCLREFLLKTLNKSSASGNVGLQILDRNWGAGWNLLTLLLAPKPSERVRCLDALRHPFLCGPRWRVDPSMDIIRWSLGSTAVRISEEYIYGHQQRTRLAHFIKLMEMLNPHSTQKNWAELLPGKWRMLYCTGRHIGLTIRQPQARVLIGDAYLTISSGSKLNSSLSFDSDIDFSVIVGQEWPHDKVGVKGRLQVTSVFRMTAGKRLYLKEEKIRSRFVSREPSTEESVFGTMSGKRLRKAIPLNESPSSLPVAKLVSDDIDVSLTLSEPLFKDVKIAQNVIQEVRTLVPPEMFDLSKLVCGTYLDSRLLILRGVNGSALLFTRSLS